MIFFAFAGMFWVWAWRGFDSECSYRHPVTVLIPEGAHLEQIGQILKDSKAIDFPVIFNLNVRIRKQSQALKAGEYHFAAHRTHHSVMDKLIQGKAILHKLTIPEGLRTKEVIEIIRNADTLEGEIPLPYPAEGTLLPETYMFTKGEERKDVVKQMQDDLESVIEPLWNARKEDFPLQSIKEVITLASIIEKETAHDDERPRVAGVFFNRLRLNMPLQSDPTVSYGLIIKNGESLGRLLNRQDLKIPTEYNTYLNSGLPLGPICNPGKASIEAVFKAVETDDLYFISDGDGRHIFSKTYKEHQKHHQNLRALRKKLKAQQQNKEYSR